MQTAKQEVKKILAHLPEDCTLEDRIVHKVNDGENVLVMFAGVGTFLIPIKKKKDGISTFSGIAEMQRCA